MHKNTIITVVVSLVMLIVLIIAVAKMQAGEKQDSSSETTSSSTNTTTQQEEKVMNEDLKIEDLTVGEGAEAVAGKEVTVHYTGTLTNGTKFDSSLDRGTPFSFELGAGDVIKGWDQGVAGMKVGGKRKLTIPAELGYGAQANGPIPANSTLIFEVELLEVK